MSACIIEGLHYSVCILMVAKWRLAAVCSIKWSSEWESTSIVWYKNGSILNFIWVAVLINLGCSGHLDDKQRWSPSSGWCIPFNGIWGQKRAETLLLTVPPQNNSCIILASQQLLISTSGGWGHLEANKQRGGLKSKKINQINKASWAAFIPVWYYWWLSRIN